MTIEGGTRNHYSFFFSLLLHGGPLTLRASGRSSTQQGCYQSSLLQYFLVSCLTNSHSHPDISAGCFVTDRYVCVYMRGMDMLSLCVQNLAPAYSIFNSQSQFPTTSPLHLLPQNSTSINVSLIISQYAQDVSNAIVLLLLS